MSDQIERIPNLSLIQTQFLLQIQSTEQLKNELLSGIQADSMSPYFQKLVALGLLKNDPKLIQSLQAKNDETLKQIEKTLLDAQENLGETEVSDALIAKANHFARIGDCPNGIAAYNLAIEKTGPLGRRIDLYFALIRIGFFSNDVHIISSTIEKVKL